MRTIDDIIPPSRRRERETFTNESTNRAPGTPRQPSRFPYKTLVGVLLVIAISLAALYYFSSALVEITPFLLQFRALLPQVKARGICRIK